MKRATLADRHCSLARAGAELVDGWTFLILREVMMLNSRFDGLQAQTGMSPRSLTLRLKSLEQDLILEKVAYQQKPQRFEYRLTEKGQALWPVIMTLKAWGDSWCDQWSPNDPPMHLQHDKCEHTFIPQIHCSHCQTVTTEQDVIPKLSDKMQQERQQMQRVHGEKKIKL